LRTDQAIDDPTQAVPLEAAPNEVNDLVAAVLLEVAQGDVLDWYI
jgi:hypothetical protein